MRIDIINELANYIRFLNETYNIEISFHPVEGQFDFMMQSYVIDSCSVRSLLCRQIINSGKEIHNKCKQHHIKCINLCKSNEIMLNTCFAGVTQLIFPTYNGKTLVGYIAAGNFYQDKNNSLSMLKSFCREEKFNFDGLKTIFENSVYELKLSVDFIKTIVSPICSMLEIAYLQGKAITIHKDDNAFYTQLLLYIKSNYTSNLDVETIAKQHNCSVSYLSHFFKKNCGMSLPEYINFLRINDAKVLLEITNMNIQEISYSIGYSSSSYFSTVFKKQTGLAPKLYRDNHNRK